MTHEEANKISREIADWAIAEELTPIKERLEDMISQALQKAVADEREAIYKMVECNCEGGCILTSLAATIRNRGEKGL